MAAHLEQARKSGAVVPDELLRASQPGRPPPFGFEFIWGVFCDLSGARGSHGFGPCGLSWSDVEAYCRLTGTALSNWELAMIFKVDQRWMKVVGEHLKETSDKPKEG